MSLTRVIKILAAASAVGYILEDACARNGVGLEQVEQFSFLGKSLSQAYSETIAKKAESDGCVTLIEEDPDLGLLPIVDCSQSGVKDPMQATANIYTFSQNTIASKHQNSFFYNLFAAGLSAATVGAGLVIKAVKGRCERQVEAFDPPSPHT